MPEPNLPPLRLSLDESVEQSDLINVPSLRKQLPVLPSVFRDNLLQKYNLSVDTVLRLLVSKIHTGRCIQSRTNKNHDDVTLECVPLHYLQVKQYYGALANTPFRKEKIK